tara:strand:- start:839 stop:1579 length:741 start_codon:yes stop_codon:yes gene_type:complete
MRKLEKMKKVLTETRMCQLAGLTEADTVDMYKSQRDARKRGRHAAEKDFFGSEVDPLVTTDVPQIEEPDPNATQKLTPDQLKQIERDVPEEARRPIALELYRSLVEPKYSEDDIEVMVHNDESIRDSLAQLIGWFHPAFQDSRGQPTYDNPSRLGVKVAEEFEKEGRDIIDDADEFTRRVEKYLYDEAREEFALAKAHSDKNPSRNVKVGQSAIPGTAAHKGLQDLFKKMDAARARSSAPTGKIKK